MNQVVNAPKKVLVIGDLMIDHYIYGNCNRISPEAPVPVVEFKGESYTLGGAGNVLENLIALDCEASIISITGDDNDCNIVLKELSDIGVSTIGIIKDTERCTTVKTRILSSKHQMIRLDKENTTPISSDREWEVINLVNQIVPKYDIVLLSDYNKGMLTPNVLKEIFTICKRAGIKTVLDPKGTDFSKYNGVNVIKPNKKEASLATGIAITNEDSLYRACVKIKQTTNCDNVIITMSEEGIAYYSNDELKIMPTKALDVVDVTGAGDTVLASLGLALACNKSIADACDFANHAAAVVVSKVGSATVKLSEIEGNHF